MTIDPSGLKELSFSGRDKEIAALVEFLNECLKARGRTVVVSGEAGIGKTRLVNEVIERAQKLGFRILEGQCLPGSATPYLPFEEALREFFRITKQDSSKVTKSKISSAIKKDAPEVRDSVLAIEQLLKAGSIIASREKDLGLRAWLRGRQRERELGLKEWLKGSKSESYQEFVIDLSRAESARERFLQTISSLIVEIAKLQPVLLFLDDLHWADSSSLTLMHLLTRRTRDARVLTIGAYRPEELSESSILRETLQIMSREDLLTEFELKPLGKGDYSEFLQETFHFNFGSQFLDWLFEETEGNPLFALETLRLLIEEGALQRKDGTWRPGSEMSRVGIPDKVMDVLARRVARLSEEERRILELASVIGEEFESSPIQDILALNKLKLLQSLASIERTYSLIESLEPGYRFTHTKVREVIYDRLTPELRRECHLLVAEWMEKHYSAPEKLDELVTVIAQHFFVGGQWEKALTYYAMAGDMAMQIHAHQEALEAYTRALQASKRDKRVLPSEISFSLLERSALAAMASGKIEEALKSFDSLGRDAQTTGNEGLFGKAKLLHGWASFWNKDLDTALQDCSKALTAARETGDKTLEGRSLYLMGTSMLAKGLREEAKTYLHDSLRISREAGDKVAETQTLLVLLMEGFQAN